MPWNVVRPEALRRVVLCLVVAAPAACSGGGLATSPELSGTLDVRDGIRVLTLWGGPRERGFAQGWLLGPELVEGLDRSLRNELRALVPAYKETVGNLIRTAFVFSASEEEELQGILDGIRARVPAEKRRLESLDREFGLDDLKALNTYGDWCAISCSSTAVWGSRTPQGAAAVVRNFEFDASTLIVEGQHVRVVAPLPGDPSSRGWVGVCYPGSVGTMTAMSTEGVFVSIHDVHVVPGLKDLAQKNVPRLVALKRLVSELPAKGAVEEAADRCRKWNTLYGNNFLVATAAPGGGAPAGVLEYDTREQIERGVTLRLPEGSLAEAIVCTNDHLRRGSGACRRYDALIGGLRKDDGELDVQDLFDLGSLAAEPAPGKVVGDRNYGTLHQVVALTGERRFWVRMAPLDRNIRDCRPIELDLARQLAPGR